MNKIKSFVAIAMLLAMMIPIGFSDNRIIVTLIRTSPTTVEPGQYSYVWFQIENTGDSNVNNFRFTLKPKFPFSLSRSDDPTKYIGTLKMYEPVVVKYKIYTSNDAVEGWNDMDYEYSYNDVKVSEKSEIYVSYIPQLQIISVSPTDISVDKKSKIDVTTINFGHGDARNVRITFDTSKTNLKIIGSNTFYYKNISSGNSVTTSFFVMGSSDENVESIPVTMTYEDNEGNYQEKAYSIGINVFGKPNIYSIIKEIDNDHVLIEIINDGPVESKFVKAVASVNGKTYKYYIGDLDSDDFDIIDIPLSSDGKNSINVTITYDTPELESMNVTSVFDVDIPQKSEGNGRTGIIIVFVLVAAFIAYRLVRVKK